MTTTARPRRVELAAMLTDVRAMPAAPLPVTVQRDAEVRSGTDLSHVRVHATPEAARYAAAMGATAFTFGNDVVVGRDATPSTLRHEAMHAAQFARHGAPSSPAGIAESDHPAHVQADAFVHDGGAGGGGRNGSLAAPGALVQREEVTEEKRKAPTSATGDLARSALNSDAGRLASALLPAGMLQGGVLATSAAAFVESFVRTVAAGMTDADRQQLDAEFKDFGPQLKFNAGLYGGIAVGAVEDLASNLKGLWDIIKVVGEFVTQPFLDTAMMLYDRDLYMQIKKEEAEHARQVIAAIWAFAKKVSADPAFLIGQGEGLGAGCGEMVSEWFHGDFMKQTPLKKGFTVGRGLGMAAMEIALLFLGPEEWVARGAIAVGRITKGSRLYRAVAELLEKIPEIARLFKAKTELDDAQKALKATKKVETVSKAAEEASKGNKIAGAAGDVPKDVPLGKATEAHAPPKVEPKAPEPPKVEPKAPESAKLEPAVEPPKVEPKAAEPPKPEPTKAPAPKPEPTKASTQPAEPAAFEPAKKPGEPVKPKEPAKPAEPAKAQQPAKAKEPAKPNEPAAPKPAEKPVKKQAAKKPTKPMQAPPPKQGAGKAGTGKGAAADSAKSSRKTLKNQSAAERAATDKRRMAAGIEADTIRKAGVRNPEGLPPGWDFDKHPNGPMRDWLPGDPVNMPDGAGNHPTWDTVRQRVWKTKAADELAARAGGKGSSAHALDPIGQLTTKELENVAKTGSMPKRVGAEIEHKRIPQRMGRMLEEAGLETTEARELTKLGDASNLEPTSKDWHAVVDQKAREINPNRNPSLDISIDDRAEFPLGSATNEEIAAIIDRINKRGIDLGKTQAGRDLRKILETEKARRGSNWAKWIVP